MKDVLLKLLLDALDKMIGPDLQQQCDEWIVARLKELAAKTESELDDKVVALVAKALGVPQ